MRISFNPCLQCGACCAFYRVSFYWAEIDDFTFGGVPSHMTVKVNDRYMAMKGTESPSPRCCSLMGEIGIHVFCGIYERRASTCRSFIPSWHDKAHNPACDNARNLWSLPPLTPDSWEGPEKLPESA